jgi:hypothetical protein
MFGLSTVPFDERAVHPFAVVLERRGEIPSMEMDCVAMRIESLDLRARATTP